MRLTVYKALKKTKKTASGGAKAASHHRFLYRTSRRLQNKSLCEVYISIGITPHSTLRHFRIEFIGFVL